MKRLICAFIVSMICLTCICNAQINAYNEQAAVEKLTEYGILENYQTSDIVTRADMAKFIVILRGLGEAAADSKSTGFADVPQEHPQFGFIAAANKFGAILGYDDNTFRPDEPVTYAQAVKMIVSALGYNPKAASLGGYPVGYLTVALQEGISTGISKSIGDTLTQKEVVRLLYNALPCPMMEQTYFHPEYAEYEVFTYKTPETFSLAKGSIFLLDDKNYVVISADGYSVRFCK